MTAEHQVRIRAQKRVQAGHVVHAQQDVTMGRGFADDIRIVRRMQNQ